MSEKVEPLSFCRKFGNGYRRFYFRQFFLRQARITLEESYGNFCYGARVTKEEPRAIGKITSVKG